MALPIPGISTGGGGFSGSSSARSGDIGALSFGGFGGLSFGDDIDGIDPRWLIGGAIAAAFLVALLLQRRR